MIRETDLPCADCGGPLVERTEPTKSLAVIDETDHRILDAEPPDRDARSSAGETREQLLGDSRFATVATTPDRPTQQRNAPTTTKTTPQLSTDNA